MKVGMLIICRATGIFHAACGFVGREILVLVRKAIIVANLLAGHQLAPTEIIVTVAAEVVVVQLGRPGHDLAARNGDTGQAQPTIGSIIGIAHLDRTRHKTAG
ncbi:MAG: hypothetical protein EP341_11195 [Sphingomonadales bacterium]|nr:MAG: hypothetical protein EP341_11195 [Sphingomonadales bacterium]